MGQPGPPKTQPTIKSVAIVTVEPKIITCKEDDRPFTEVKIYNECLVGLLDSGAQSTICGGPFAEIVAKYDLKLSSANTVVKNADGTEHLNVQNIELPIEYNGSVKTVIALFVPSIPRNLILGIDFWRTFNIRPVICETVEATKIINVSDSISPFC